MNRNRHDRPAYGILLPYIFPMAVDACVCVFLQASDRDGRSVISSCFLLQTTFINPFQFGDERVIGVEMSSKT